VCVFFFPQSSPLSLSVDVDSDTDDDDDEKYKKRMRDEEEALKSEGLAKFCLQNLRETDRDRLKPGEWISDGLIHCFIEYYRRVVSEVCAQNNVKKVFFYETTFMSDFSKAHVASYASKVPFAKDLFSFDFWVFPVCVKNEHWALAIICYPADEKRARIVILDSLKSFSTKSTLCVNLENVKVYFGQQHARKFKEENKREIPTLYPWVDAVRMLFLDGMPQQNNSYDCGVFLLYFLRVFLFTPLLESTTCSAWCPQLKPDIHLERKRLEDLLSLLGSADSPSATAANLVPESLLSVIQSDFNAVVASQVNLYVSHFSLPLPDPI
jgi:Ulp1 family protease